MTTRRAYPGRCVWQPVEMERSSCRGFFLAQYWVGAAGMPGQTAWYGLENIAKPQKGETIFISAASGSSFPLSASHALLTPSPQVLSARWSLFSASVWASRLSAQRGATRRLLSCATCSSLTLPSTTKPTTLRFVLFFRSTPHGPDASPGHPRCEPVRDLLGQHGRTSARCGAFCCP